MTATDFNERVRLAARHQRLPGFIRQAGGTPRHKWKVACARADEDAAQTLDFGLNPLTGLPYFSAWVFSQPGKSAKGRLWAVTVGTGCVNDQPACIEYLAQGDPRGWQMPENYAPYAALVKVFGPKYRFVDRPLWEEDRPFLFLTAPDATGRDLGGFEPVSNAARPPFFRTAEAWERELYVAYVAVAVSPFRADPAAANLAIGGARATRWRVTAGKRPQAVADAGVAKIASHVLARIYLLRTPGKPEDDEIHVRQDTYWNLRCRSSINTELLALIGVTAEALAGLDIGLLALGATGVLTTTVLLGIEAAVANIILANIEAIVAATSGVEFWSV